MMPEDNNGLNAEQQKDLSLYREMKRLAEEFCEPYFENFVRYDNLYRGQVPDELDGTFSKVVFPLAFTAVQDEIPRMASSIFSSPDFFSLQANSPVLDPMSDAAEAWLKYQVTEKMQLFPRIIPTLQSQAMHGTGYQKVSHKYTVGTKDGKQIKRSIITSQHKDIFSIMPLPGGGIVNPDDGEQENGVDGLFDLEYYSADYLKREGEKGRFNLQQINRMIASDSGSSEGDHKQREYQQQTQSGGNSNSIGGLGEASQRKNDAHKDSKNRYACQWFYQRNKWMLVAEDQWLIYSGKPLLDCFPIAKYIDTPNGNDWYGTGLIEVAEDIIHATLLNTNHRFDYLAGTLHPTKWIRQDVYDLNSGNTNAFDPEPYGINLLPKAVNDIRSAVWYDRFPDISSQAFLEDNNLKTAMQEATAQPNYSKGQGGAGTLANETATGITSLIDQGNSRSQLKALITEHTGLHDQLKLVLKWGAKHMTDDEEIPITGEGGYPWRMVESEAITDGYSIRLSGTRQLNQKQTALRNMMSQLPFLVNNPSVQNQPELLSQMMSKSDTWDNVDNIVVGTPPPGTGGQPPPQEAPPNVAGESSLQNDMQSVDGSMARTPDQIGA
jgi:hypothetical protein